MNHLGTMYATKRRRRNSKSVRVASKEGQTKSNPSKRHRERLNAELDTLASLLPYEQSVLSKLDKLSILRLSVSYLRTKSYFQFGREEDAISHEDSLHFIGLDLARKLRLHECRQNELDPNDPVSIGVARFARLLSSIVNCEQPNAALHKEKERQGQDHGHKPRELLYPESLMEGDLILQALNGFLLILTCEGEVFYASHTVETYLGFHQSDICHQSVYELVHSEDREELQRHLMWNSHLPSDRSAITMQETLLPENTALLERNFTVRFRCLLDNTSGFLRLDIRGRIKILHGQNQKTEDPPLALFAVCTPFGPPSLLEMPQKDSMFKSKHKLDLSLVSMDQRGRQLLGYTDTELGSKGGYDLVHFDDLAYVASAHQELLKTGASGLIAYRLTTKEGKWQWLQTSARLVYKNSKPDFILCTHRPLMEEEGRDLLGKRTMDFKVTYLDGGLGAMTDRSGLLSDNEFVSRCQKNRRYKSQIRDLLSTCRKRKTPGEQYLEETGYNNVYPYPTENINGISPYAAAAAMPQNLFTAAIDNSRFLTPENFLHYRHLGSYYSEYAHHPAAQYPSNGFLDMTSAAARTCFPAAYPDSSQLGKDEKLYACQLDAAKFNGDAPRLVQQVSVGPKPSCCEGYMSTSDPSGLRGCLMSATGGGIQPLIPTLERDSKLGDLGCRNLNFGLSSVPVTMSTDCLNVIKHRTTSSLPSRNSPHTSSSKDSNKMDPSATSSVSQPSLLSAFTSANDTRQSVLMWGNSHPRTAISAVSVPPTTTALYDGKLSRYGTPTESSKPSDLSSGSVACKWNGSVVSAKSTSPHHHSNTSPHPGKVPLPVNFSGSAYTSEVGLELPLVRQDHGRPPSTKQEGNPLLSISEVTNTLLNHE